MKARLVPVYFKAGMDEDFRSQLANLKKLLTEVADFQEPMALGSRLQDADAVVFPQLLGDAFRQIQELKKINLPFLVLTSEFGTVNMWDWEIVSFMKSEGIQTFAPYSIELTKKICRSIALKREMKHSKFLVFQDNTENQTFGHEVGNLFWREIDHSDDLLVQEVFLFVKLCELGARLLCSELAEIYP